MIKRKINIPLPYEKTAIEINSRSLHINIESITISIKNIEEYLLTGLLVFTANTKILDEGEDGSYNKKEKIDLILEENKDENFELSDLNKLTLSFNKKVNENVINISSWCHDSVKGVVNKNKYYTIEIIAADSPVTDELYISDNSELTINLENMFKTGQLLDISEKYLLKDAKNVEKVYYFNTEEIEELINESKTN